jgi:hypothetical protein
VLESARTLEFGFAFDDPGIGGRLAVKSFRLAMDNDPSFLDD